MKTTKTILLAVLFAGILTSCTRIKPGYAGFKISYSGDYRGTDSLPQEVGWVWYSPGFSTVVEFPTFMQHITYTQDPQEGSKDNQEIIVGLKGGSSFKLNVGLNYMIKANRAAHIYFKFKTSDLEDINQGYLRNTTRKVLNDLAGAWTMDSLLNSRPLFEKTAEQNLSKILATDGIILNQLSILKTPEAVDPNLETAINAKIKAKQDAERKQTELQSSIADANKKIADARGDSARTVIEAAGKAAANQKMEQALTPAILRQQWINKWDGKLPQYIMGGNSNVLMQMPDNNK